MDKQSKEERVSFTTLHKKLIEDRTFISCLNCDNFINETCAEVGMKPPAHTIVFGCEYWNAEIPF